jgi:hypothetical protein
MNKISPTTLREAMPWGQSAEPAEDPDVTRVLSGGTQQGSIAVMPTSAR